MLSQGKGWNNLTTENCAHCNQAKERLRPVKERTLKKTSLVRSQQLIVLLHRTAAEIIWLVIVVTSGNTWFGLQILQAKPTTWSLTFYFAYWVVVCFTVWLSMALISILRNLLSSLDLRVVNILDILWLFTHIKTRTGKWKLYVLTFYDLLYSIMCVIVEYDPVQLSQPLI